MPTRILVPSGVLGLGFDGQALERGLELRPDIICIDGGSTDSGPFYLGTGSSKYAHEIYKSEWRELMIARERGGIPLVLSSCGTCGTNSMVDLMYELTKEIAKDLKQNIKVALLYSDQSIEYVIEAFNASKLSELSPAPKLSIEQLTQFSNIVALAGAEQITEALDTGADIILAGRTTDTAIISALPLKNGDLAGGAWHGAKIAECGAFCSTVPNSGVILVDFDKTGFTVEPMALEARCTPNSVSAHMLYENVDPFILHEPGGYLDVTNAKYTALSNRKVRVEGAKWITSADYTVKLEGAYVSGYQTITMVIVRDSRYVKNIQIWIAKLTKFLIKKIEINTNVSLNDYSLDFHLIGINSTLGDLETKVILPVEVGVQLIVTASSQKIATELSKLVNPYILHFPLTDTEPLPTFAFPYSPAQIDRGALYEFGLNHVMSIKEPMECFQLKLHELSYD